MRGVSLPPGHASLMPVQLDMRSGTTHLSGRLQGSP